MKVRSSEIIELLLDERLKEKLDDDPELMAKKDENGNTLLHHAVLHNFRQYNGQEKNDKILNILLAKAKKSHYSCKNKSGNTPLHLAAIESNNYILEKYIGGAKKAGFDFTTTDNAGLNILHFTAKMNLRECFNMVLDCMKEVEDLNCATKSGSTAFHYAVREGNFDGANALLNAGANPVSKSKDRDPFTLVTNTINEAQKRMTSTGKTQELCDIKSNYEKLEKNMHRCIHRCRIAEHLKGLENPFFGKPSEKSLHKINVLRSALDYIDNKIYEEELKLVMEKNPLWDTASKDSKTKEMVESAIKYIEKTRPIGEQINDIRNNNNNSP